MHNVLVIQEILSNIFGHAHAQKGDLASLASTCRAFKEPALDILWEDLKDLSVLALCLPEASHECQDNPKCYSFHRPLVRTEWETLRSYTRRIKYIFLDDVNGLDQKSLESLSKPPSGESLFPNVRRLLLDTYTSEKATPLFLLPLPSLTWLLVQVYDLHLLANSLHSLVKTSPKLVDLTIYPCDPDDVDMSGIDLRFVCQLQNLKNVDLEIPYLDITSLVHLTSMPALTRLSFTVSSTLPSQIPLRHVPLLFLHLCILSLNAESLDTVSQFLSRARMPHAISLNVLITYSPSRQDLSSFFSSISTSGMDRITELYLEQYLPPGHTSTSQRDALALCLEDLEPCMAFKNLFRFVFDIECTVNLTDKDLLTLTSNWRHFHHLLINEQWGWNTQGGITPNGLRALILENAYLDNIALAIDTRGFTAIPPLSSDYNFDFPGKINVVDSFIEAESMSAIAALLARMWPISGSLSLSGWCDPRMERNPNRAVCENRWHEVLDMMDSWEEEEED